MRGSGAESTHSNGDGPPEIPPKPEVIVVGAGVSGCACAATLAMNGIRVTLLNSALDSVGQPGYGPVVCASDRDWSRIVGTLATLPQPLRNAWLDACSVADIDTPLLFVDRRMLSIETKRALERMTGLEFRQGLVTEVRIEPQEGTQALPGGIRSAVQKVVVTTAFGEAIAAEAVVLAVGLSLGGRVRVGDDVLSGGRYGETPSDELRDALAKLGITFREVRIEVGSRFPRAQSREWCLAPVGLTELSVVDEVDATSANNSVSAELLDGKGSDLSGVKADVPKIDYRTVTAISLRNALGMLGADWLYADNGSCAWSSDYPPAPHWSEELREWPAVIVCRQENATVPWMLPDGVATGEAYLAQATWHSELLTGHSVPATRHSVPTMGHLGVGALRPAPETALCKARVEAGVEYDGSRGLVPASRLQHTVTGLVATEVDFTGRVMLGRDTASVVWVAGRVGGTVDYLESLASGVRVGRSVADALLGTLRDEEKADEASAKDSGDIPA